MKKPTLTLLALLALTLTGCMEDSQMGKVNTDQQQLNSVYDKIVTAEYNGHSYIIYKGYRKGGITHDPDCPCREKGESHD
jgi:uncharacterized lipoprotein NlpE involved in copper resistance